MNSFNVAAKANQHIFDFVRKRANVRLRPGTGSYSAPFRGSLFGVSEGEAVAKRLKTRQVDALWLGTNPCVSRSLEHILNTRSGEGDFEDFKRHMKSGSFPALRWDVQGMPSADWNPLQNPTATWMVYRDVLAAIFDLEAITMANFIPWGSQNADALADGLDSVDPDLLRDVVGFADTLNEEIVKTLRPRLLVVPLSLGRHKRLAPKSIALASAKDVRPHHVATPEGRVTFYTGTCERSGATIPTVYARHPSSLQLSVESRKRLGGRMVSVLGDFVVR